MKASGKTAVVTGAASGIGAAIAHELAKRGVRVAVADFDENGASAVAEEIGSLAKAFKFDAADVESIEALGAAIESSMGEVDMVFANAGVSSGAPLLQSTVDAFDWQFAVNVRGVWATAKTFLSRMIESGRAGHFTITASEHSLGLQHLGAGVYTGTKHAVLGLAEILRGETPENIAISVLLPGLVNTQLHDAGRFGVVPGADAQGKAFGSAIMSRGMTADEIAVRAVDGTECGDFYIVTHPTSFAAAQRRFAEIKAAYEAQAPMTEEARQYDVNQVISNLRAEMGA